MSLAQNTHCPQNCSPSQQKCACSLLLDRKSRISASTPRPKIKKINYKNKPRRHSLPPYSNTGSPHTAQNGTDQWVPTSARVQVVRLVGGESYAVVRRHDVVGVAGVHVAQSVCFLLHHGNVVHKPECRRTIKTKSNNFLFCVTHTHMHAQTHTSLSLWQQHS